MKLLQNAPALLPRKTEGNESDTVILVAEDDPVNRLLISEVLKKLGLKVLTASNGKEAVASVSHDHPSLIFMDINMPEMDGYEATRAIRRLSAPERDIPIVALTADVITADKNHCRQAGMNQYITKPFQLQSIEDVLRYYALVA